MVKGLEVFRKYFSDFEDQYVIIGGAACDIHIQAAELTPRATKDIDILKRIEKGGNENRKLLRKHKGDVFRLGILLAESDVFELPDQVLDDLKDFLALISDDLPDKAIFREMGIAGIAAKNVFDQIKSSLLP